MHPIEEKLVVGISSNALFDLKKEDEIFNSKGLEEYKKYQVEYKNLPLNKGVAFPFISRFLNINTVYHKEKPAEVVLLSRNSPETGVRIFNSIKHYGLDITRAAFMSGQSAIQYINAFNICLFLTTEEKDVKEAIEQNLPAGKILQTEISDGDKSELRIAFDFDGVIADDEAEKIFKEKGLDAYQKYEEANRAKILESGPLADFFKKISFFQKLESKKKQQDSTYKKILKTAIITARSAPAHERAINTLNDWGVEVDEMFLLGGINKTRVLEIMKPHLYFDDQKVHLNETVKNIPMVHIPFGIANEAKKRGMDK